jgi:inorganic pyrophosphatase
MISSLEDQIQVAQIVICVPKNDKTIDKFHDCKKVACSLLLTIICDNWWHFTTFSKEYLLLWKHLHKHDMENKIIDRGLCNIQCATRVQNPFVMHLKV